ncbi:PerC family transcriptional regulator [Rahnella ecdela]|jgi:hypothetical protein|uniref:PerC family transcriptional regulator n=1 Tax=Rahnella ecdela TaxID=2816250 RepID=A0ABS6LDD2_9GAMM|nr:PerC family transcriptional regulator [Rahnella ecdela]MBU9844770.1 PerC family transcriptional regulator [Rahnella ecdela]
MNDLSILKQKASVLERKGLFRRAILVWQEISLGQTFSQYERELALIHLKRLSTIIDKKAARQREGLKTFPDRYKNIAQDKDKIIQLLHQGVSAKEIQHLTQRSRDFIYNCKRNS